jgi:hypothetical protein
MERHKSLQTVFTEISSKRTTKVTKKPTNFMEQGPPWDTYNYSATQEIPRILLKPEVHYLLQKSP